MVLCCFQAVDLTDRLGDGVLPFKEQALKSNVAVLLSRCDTLRLSDVIGSICLLAEQELRESAMT